MKKIFYSKLWGLMLPIVLQNLMLALVAVADVFMLGGMDQNYMSAVSLATQIQFIQNMFLSAATASLGILGAQYWGKGDIRTLDEIFCMALRLCGLVQAVIPYLICTALPCVCGVWQFRWQQPELTFSTGRWYWCMHAPASMKLENCRGYCIIFANTNG